MLILLAGRIGAGKSTLARAFAESFGTTVHQFSFADALKQTCNSLFDCGFGYGPNGKDEITSVKWEDLPHYQDILIYDYANNKQPRRGFLTLRELWQQFGTEIVRRMDPDAFARNLIKRLNETYPDKDGKILAIVDDWRFESEINYCLARHETCVPLWVQSPPDSPTEFSHISENQIKAESVLTGSIPYSPVKARVEALKAIVSRFTHSAIELA